MARQRGRKRTNDLYFGPEEEEAVVRFLGCNDEIERNAIYNEWLRAPFNKMIESIIRRYKLYRKGVSFEDLHSDTLSFLITKADKFNINSGKKSYSSFTKILQASLPYLPIPGKSMGSLIPRSHALEKSCILLDFIF